MFSRLINEILDTLTSNATFLFPRPFLGFINVYVRILPEKKIGLITFITSKNTKILRRDSEPLA